jgi:serine protease Do
MRNKLFTVIVFKKVWILLISLGSVWLFYDCSGWSPSGVKKRAENNDNKASRTNYTKSESNKEQPSGIQSTTSDLSLNQLFKRYQPAVFMVFTSDGEQGYQGTGFFVSSDGIAVSNYHVFEGTSRGLEIIKIYNGQELKIESVLTQSKEDDYIIFKVRLRSNVNFIPIPICYIKPDIGEDVFVIGNPHGLEHTLSKGIVSGFRENDKLIQTSAEITHGSSGGPLLNMRGEVVGITTAGLGEANINFAVNINHLPLQKYHLSN